MFTGLVQALAEVVDVAAEPSSVRITIREPHIAATAKLGDSIAINGCCLTAIGIEGDCLTFQAGEETLLRTNLGTLTPGAKTNLEPSLRASDPIGGHYVTGHIDCLAIVDARQNDDDWCKMWFRVPAAQLAQMASKGSVAVDGVSLTLVDVENERFSVALIPHTLTTTTLGSRRPGDKVNIETDVLAKYVQAQLTRSAANFSL